MKAFHSHLSEEADKARERGADTFAISGQRNELYPFLTFARGWLRNNLPAGFDFSGAAPALRFQNGDVLQIVNFPPGEAPGMDGVVSGGVPVNLRTRNDGRGDTVGTPSWGITGQEKRD